MLAPSWGSSSPIRLAVAAFLLLALLLCADGASAHSTRPPPLRRVHHPARSSIRISPRGNLVARARTSPSAVTLRHDDSLLLTASLPSLAPYELGLLLEPTVDLFHPDAQVVFNDGAQRTALPLFAEDYRLYTGRVVAPQWIDRVWAEHLSGLAHSPEAFTGRASVMVHESGPDVRWEGSFNVGGRQYHVMTREHYESVKESDDADVAEFGNYLVVFSDKDMAQELRSSSNYSSCAHDKLDFNMDSRHPVRRGYDSMWARDDMGGQKPSTNYINSIGSNSGCPKSPQVVYMGVAVDCNYVQAYNGADQARTQVLNNWNQISNLYRSTFNVSIAIMTLQVESGQCPTTAPADAPWNINCTNSVTIDDRLSTFSKWRGTRGEDGAGLWHLMTACPTDSEVGVAWLGTLCQTSVNQQDGNQFVSGAGVSSASKTEWNLISHEIGHGFGAIHDCLEGCSLSSQCCPFSAQSCDANGQFIMNPTTAEKESAFSQCTLGNICTFLGTGSKSCVMAPDNRVTISLKQCGNGIVEDGEECDPGGGNSTCCTDQCKLVAGAKCDPANSACCESNCQLKSAGAVCRPSINPTCDMEEVCNGTSAACPADKTAKDGTKCGNGLQCASGHCTSLNEQCQKAGTSMNLTTACKNRDESCLVSCMDPTQPNTCTILQTVLVDGSPCGYGGHCYSGKCKAGTWQERFQAMYLQNLQISIPVTVVVGLIVLAILWSLLRCCLNCCRRTKSVPPNKHNSMPMMPHPPQNGYAPPPPNTRGYAEYPAAPNAQPLLGGQTPYHGRGESSTYSDETDGAHPPMREAYTDPYAAGPGGYGNPRHGDWVDDSMYNGPNYEQHPGNRYDPRDNYQYHHARETSGGGRY